MKPKLKPDVYWVPQGDALAFIHPGDPLTVRGRSALPLMDRLAPYLDGSIELDELVGGLPEGKRDMVLTMVTALHDAGLVKDVQDDDPNPLSAAEMARYGAEIAYIDHHLSSAARRFHDFRTTRITCLGAGLSLHALAHACLRAGVLELTVLVAGDCPTDTDLLDRYLADSRESDPAQRLHLRSFSDSAGELSDAVAGADLLLHVSDRPVLARARDLDRLCREHGRPLLQGIVVDDEAWTGPIGGSVGAGWESAWLRARSNRPRPADADLFPETAVPESPFLAGPTASIVGNRVAFLAFQYVTGVSGARGGLPAETVSVVDLETLDTTEHRFLPHPGAGPASPESQDETARRFADLLSRPAHEPAAFSRAAAELFDARLGPMRTLDESDLPQLPLHLAEVTVADPFGLLDTRDGHPGAVGLGDSFAAARHQAALRAFELYATLAVDRRRLRRGDGPDRVFARDLASGAWEAIDAELAYPALAKPGPAETFMRPVGLAAALGGDEALRMALLDHCAALAAGAVDRAREPFPQLPLDAAELTGSTALYLDATRTALPGLRCYDLTAVHGVPALAWCDGEATIGYTAGSDHVEAIKAGLVQALLYYQAAESGRPRLAPPAAPELPARLRGESVAAPDAAVARLGWPELVSTLAAQGHRVHAVAVGHDPVVTAVLPAVVQVVVR
ncbi:hypothetical protein Rhe02_34360 [Rhizocola hellebori]|uniref:YcaO domain-containing protein n=1 Tax=Rhizocola hellebori TaxID=1392758 RepID=A0A8J3Q7F1_9ACTN|nr:hypothetical protein [Rhizocola hellebori]GIH05369.1 hypothetical protein Rhe02_34360 [Rhizocola hellebori]